MEVNQQLVRQGSRLFRWRSFLPLTLLPLVLLAMRDGEYVRLNFGDAVDSAWEAMCIAGAFAGLALRSCVVGHVPAGTSGRNTRNQKADALNQTGMYSIVRHPIYLANYILFLGILLFVQSLWLVLAGSLIYWLYYERIILAEEDFLARKFGGEYTAWAALTPSVIPQPALWRQPSLPFSLRAVLARENSGAGADGDGSGPRADREPAAGPRPALARVSCSGNRALSRAANRQEAYAMAPGGRQVAP